MIAAMTELNDLANGNGHRNAVLQKRNLP